ncbi:hypothetical protein ACO1O0_005424 [Amphichorda felina]
MQIILEVSNHHKLNMIPTVRLRGEEARRRRGLRVVVNTHLEAEGARDLDLEEAADVPLYISTTRNQALVALHI